MAEDKSSSYPLVHLSDFEPISDDTLHLFPIGLVRRNLIIPVAKRGDRIIAVVPKTEGIVKPEGLRLVAGCPVDLAIAPVDEIIAFIEKHYPEAASPEAASPIYPPEKIEAPVPQGGQPCSPALESTAEEEPMERAQVSEPEVPRLGALPSIFEKMLAEAVKNRAREILVEQRNDNFRFRQRIKGVLLSDGPWQAWSKTEFVEMMVAARSLGDPHSEGGAKWTEGRREVSVGEDKLSVIFKLTETAELNVLSIHIFSSSVKPFGPTEWGMDAVQAKLFEELIHARRGLVLFCGMDQDNIGGTMRNCVRKFSTSDQHVMMVENHLFEWIPDVDQFSAAGNDRLFGELLRGNLRHLPDLMAVDPLAQKNHLEICLQAALSGARIFGRFSAWDAADALSQMISLGIDPHLLRYGVNGFVTQRVLRMNCPQCQKKDDIRREQSKEIGVPIEMVPPYFYSGAGCDNCHMSGFDREIEIYEIVRMTEEMKKHIAPDFKTEKIRPLIKTEGMSTLRQIALRKAIDGQTSLAEVIRATQK